MRRLRHLLLLLATALAPAALLPAAATADQPGDWLAPFDVWVRGGTSSWHPEPRFDVVWSRLIPSHQPPFPSAVDYLVRAADGSTALPRTRISWQADDIQNLRVPLVPGRYTVEFWLEGEGREGPHAGIQLLFDNTRPGTPRVQEPPPWFGSETEPVLQVRPPAGSPPPSGIAGYAASVDQGGGGLPCAGDDGCAAAAIDSRPGADADLVPLGTLPEGTDFVRVLAVSGAGLRSPAPATVVVHVDRTAPRVALAGLPQGWAAAPVRVAANAADQLSGMVASGAGGPSTAIAIDGGAATVSPGAAAFATVTGDGVHRIGAYARDAAGNVGTRDALVRIDEEPPSVWFARAQDPAEPERIVAGFADGLSGPDDRRGSIAVRLVGSAQRFAPLPTVVEDGRLSALWDSDSFPPGSYEFRATAYDLAGNATAADRRGDGARMILANPLKAPARLQFGFGARRLVWQRCARVGAGRRCHRRVITDFENRPARRATPFGHGVAVGGRLTTTTGQPLGGLPVRLVEAFDPGSPVPPRTTVVQTAADGSFSARLAPGPSRRVEAVFAGDRVLSRASSREIRLGVLASLRLRASSARARIGGRPVVFSGRLDGEGARIPATGRPVELQFRVPGGSWSEFRTVQTDAHGRFRYAYAFADDDSRGVRFQFRASAPAAEDWPYEPASSRPVFVTGL